MNTPARSATDLQQFDVPDPPRPPGWKLRCLLATLLGLGVAAGFIRAVRLPHLVWVGEHHSGFVGDMVLGWLERDYDPETLRPWALGISDPVRRGHLHEALAGCGDPAQLEAMRAYLDSLDYLEPYGAEVVRSMLTLDRTRGAALLVAACEPGEGVSEERADQMSGLVLSELTPADQAPQAVKLRDPARRGRFHAALATTKDPAHIPAILTYAESVVPTDPGSARPAEWEPLVASLAAFGPAATPALEQALEQASSRSLVSLAAEALRGSNLPFLVRRARELLEAYDEGVPQLARDARLIDLIEEGNRPEELPEEEEAAARERLEAASRSAFLIFELLRALEQVRGDQSVDFCIVRGLSTFNREIAEWSAQRIKDRFDADQLVDTLFSYMAQKSQFSMAEVDLYEGLISELGAPGAARVATNLERLIDAAEGDPEEVFWLYKKMGFTLLRALGGPEALSVLRRYAKDSGSYILTTTTTDASGQRTREEEVHRYADEVQAAIAAIEARGSAPPDEEPPPEEPPPEEQPPEEQPPGEEPSGEPGTGEGD